MCFCIFAVKRSLLHAMCLPFAGKNSKKGYVQVKDGDRAVDCACVAPLQTTAYSKH